MLVYTPYRITISVRITRGSGQRISSPRWRPNWRPNRSSKGGYGRRDNSWRSTTADSGWRTTATRTASPSSSAPYGIWEVTRPLSPVVVVMVTLMCTAEVVVVVVVRRDGIRRTGTTTGTAGLRCRRRCRTTRRRWGWGASRRGGRPLPPWIGEKLVWEEVQESAVAAAAEEEEEEEEDLLPELLPDLVRLVRVLPRREEHDHPGRP